MPSLNWIGKKDIKNHHNHVEYRVIDCKESVGDTDNGNLILQGDNLLALKALLPYYAGRVKTIYIDPPYNTGNTKWIYNDAVDSPVIKKWLEKTVDKEDLSRTDKWLCMMYPRLKLLQQFLREDGVIFISIDDAELHNLKAICHEIFGAKNWIETFIWNTDGNIDNQRKIKNNHEYILAYAKDINLFKSPKIIDPNIEEESKLFNEYIENTIVKNGTKNPASDIVIPIGFPCDFEQGVISHDSKGFPNISNDIHVKNYRTINEGILNSGWSSKNLFLQFIENNYKPIIDTKGQETVFKLKQSGAPYAFKKRLEDQSHVLSVLKNMGSTQQMNSFLEKLGLEFDYPKPLNLIKYLLSINDDPNGIFLDSFAGTGTTANAILEMNKDGGNRKFILIEMLDYAKTITAERNKKIIEGYSYTDKKGKSFNVDGLGGGFQYCELSEPLLDEFGLLSDHVSFEILAKHIYFTEFGVALPQEHLSEEDHYAGKYKNKELFVYLDQDFNLTELHKMTQKEADEYIAFVDTWSISEDLLRKYNITVKRLPIEIKGA
ncbi:site-specific DNA-methyltransferase [Sulfurimonas sp.]|uniref:site-specific DNA-methyltransferase n=1 Tax=Sulfurimonas sp. TaxID=2022749 RepID=UPI0025EEF5F9|nr:site-specific DNA-methyltransferase [Sulfurimonas sp.]